MTRPSVDGGRDAIGTYRMGQLADRIALDFALEAKCYAPENGVGVKELAPDLASPSPAVRNPGHDLFSRPTRHTRNYATTATRL